MKRFSIFGGVMGIGGLLWWAGSEFGKPHRHAEAVMPPVHTNSAASLPSKDPAHAPVRAKAAWTPAPGWQNRVNRIIQADGQPGNVEFDIEIEALAQEVAPENIQAALDRLMQSGLEQKPLVSWLGLLLYKRWAEHAPAEAAQWLAKLSDSNFSSTARVYLADAWAASDLDRAVAWLNTLPENQNKIDVQLAIATGAADQKKASRAIELLSSLPASPKRDQLLGYSVRAWAAKDRSAALEWLNRLDSPAWREQMLGKIAADWAATQPQEAVQFALDSIPPGKSQHEAVATGVRNWAVLAPDKAASWVGRLSEGPLRNAAIESVAEVWAKDDPGRAAEWLSSLPAGVSRDTAVSMYALTLASTSPEQAIRWADTIQNETLRASVRDQLKKQ